MPSSQQTRTEDAGTPAPTATCRKCSKSSARPLTLTPRPDPACLYGLVGEIAKAGSDTTEANPFAIAASAIAYLGVAVGRGPYMPIGNTWHHARFFMLHVGRSGEGRKGDAVSLTKRIARRLSELSPDHAPQVHSGGLSSREGLVFMIHDGYHEGKEEVPAILDKRLLVIESEFVNILHQGKQLATQGRVSRFIGKLLS